MASPGGKQARLDDAGLAAQVLYDAAPVGSLPLETLEALALARFVVLLRLAQLPTEEERTAAAA